MKRALVILCLGLALALPTAGCTKDKMPDVTPAPDTATVPNDPNGANDGLMDGTGTTGRSIAPRAGTAGTDTGIGTGTDAGLNHDGWDTAGTGRTAVGNAARDAADGAGDIIRGTMDGIGDAARDIGSGVRNAVR